MKQDARSDLFTCTDEPSIGRFEGTAGQAGNIDGGSLKWSKLMLDAEQSPLHAFKSEPFQSLLASLRNPTMKVLYASMRTPNFTNFIYGVIKATNLTSMSLFLALMYVYRVRLATPVISGDNISDEGLGQPKSALGAKEEVVRSLSRGRPLVNNDQYEAEPNLGSLHASVLRNVSEPNYGHGDGLRRNYSRQHSESGMSVSTAQSNTNTSTSPILPALEEPVVLPHPVYMPNFGFEYRMFCTAVVLASKYLDDKTYTNKSWSKITGIRIEELNRMEREFLTLLNFQLAVKEIDFIEWIRIVEELFNHV